MKLFREKQLQQALDHAAEGGQALHCHKDVLAGDPYCFQAAINRGEHIGCLYDQDEARLRNMAGILGLRRIHVCRKGHPRQHVALCGGPMAKAMLFHHADVQAKAAAPGVLRQLIGRH